MNGTFLRTDVYILFYSCYSKLKNFVITKLNNAPVIGICDSTLDHSVLDLDISIDNHKILRCDRNRQGGGVVCYVKNDLSYNTLSKLEIFSLKS